MKKLVSLLLAVILLLSAVGLSAAESDGQNNLTQKEKELLLLNSILNQEKAGDSTVDSIGTVVPLKDRGVLQVSIKTTGKKKAVQGAKVTVYSIVDEKNSQGMKLATIKTNSEGIASVVLPVGKYYISQPKLPAGYAWEKNDTNKQFRTFSITEGNVHKIGLKCITDASTAEGKLKLILHDSNGNPVKGAKYYIVKDDWVKSGATTKTSSGSGSLVATDKKITIWDIPSKKDIYKTITTDKNGTAVVSLPTGSYKVVRDSKLPLGYTWFTNNGFTNVTVGTPIKSFKISGEQTKKITDTCAIDSEIGTLVVNVKDNNGSPVSGAKIYISSKSGNYTEYDSIDSVKLTTPSDSLNLYKVAKTNKKGNATVKLPTGKYEIILSEESLPSGYTWGNSSQAETKGFTIKAGKTKGINLTCKVDKREQGAVKFTLRDNYKNPVAGAKFYVYIMDTDTSYQGKSSVKIIKTNTDGIAMAQLPVGKYYIPQLKESLPKGYEWNGSCSSVYWKTFEVKKDKTVSMSATCVIKKNPADQVPEKQKGTLQITLLDKKGNPVKGAKFTVKYNGVDVSNNNASTLFNVDVVTDSNGIAKCTLPEGPYHIDRKDNSLPVGYSWVKTGVQTDTKLNWKEFKIQKGKTTKVSAVCYCLDESDRGIIKLVIKDQYGVGVPNATYLVSHYEVSGTSMNMGEFRDLKTNKNGIAVARNVPVGSYNLNERAKELPEGYEIQVIAKSHPFNVKKNKTTKIELNNVINTKANKGKGKLVFALTDTTDRNKVVPVANAVITVYENPVNEPFKLGNVAAKITTDKYGKASVILPEGNYTITQGSIELPKGYTWKFYVNTIKWKNFTIKDSETVYLSASCVKGEDPIFIKVTEADFTIYCHVENDEFTELVPGVKFSIYYGGSKVATLTTGDSGTVNTGNLAPGTYTIVCESVPEGFVKPEKETTYKLNPYAKTRWAHVYIKREPGFTAPNKANFAVVCQYEGNGKMNKVKGVGVTVRDANGKKIQDLVTDKDGFAYTDELPAGKYTITCTSTPSGYEAMEKTITYNHNTAARTRWAYMWMTRKETGKVQFSLHVAKSEDDKFSKTTPVANVEIPIWRLIKDDKGGLISNELVTTVKTNDQGIAISDSLPAGDYFTPQFNLPAKYTWGLLVNTLQWKTYTVKPKDTAKINIICYYSNDDTKTLADFDSVILNVPTMWQNDDGTYAGAGFSNQPAMGSNTENIIYDGSDITFEGKKITTKKASKVYGSFHVLPQKPEDYVSSQGFKWKKVEGIEAYWKKVDGKWVYAIVVCPKYFGLKGKNGQIYSVIGNGDQKKTLSDFESIKVSIPSSGGVAHMPTSSLSDYTEYDGSKATVKGKKITSKEAKKVYGSFDILEMKPEDYLKAQGFKWKKVEGVSAYWKKVDGQWKYARVVCPKYFVLKSNGTKVYKLTTK